MPRRSAMSSAISTTDSTEEPNHRLHWLPRLDRRATICESKRHRERWGWAPEPRPPQGPLGGPFCPVVPTWHTPPSHRAETSSPSQAPHLPTLSTHPFPSPLSLAPYLLGPTSGPQKHPLIFPDGHPLRPPREPPAQQSRAYRDRGGLGAGFVVQLPEEDVEFGDSISLVRGSEWEEMAEADLRDPHKPLLQSYCISAPSQVHYPSQGFLSRGWDSGN